MTTFNSTCHCDLIQEPMNDFYTSFGVSVASATVGAVAYFGEQALRSERVSNICSFARERIGACLSFLNPRRLLRSAVSQAACSTPFRSLILIPASLSGDARLVRLLLDCGPIYDRAREESILFLLNQHDRNEILDILDPTGEIRIRVRDRAREISLGTWIWTLENFHLVQSQSLDFLHRIARQGFPRYVRLEGSSALDAGGLRKQLLTTLFKGLDTAFNMPANRLPTVDPKQTNILEGYTALGKCFSHLKAINETRSSDPFLIGAFFNPEFFSILKICLQETSPEARLDALARFLPSIDPSLQMPAEVFLHPEDAAKQQAFIEVFECTPEESSRIAQSILEQYLLPAQRFLQGCDEGLLTLLQNVNSQDIAMRFQGREVTVDTLLSSLEIEAPQEGLFAQQITWLQEAIRESTPAWREAFVLWATGKTTLAPSSTIKIDSTFTRDICAHTCFNSIELPKEMTEKEAFLMSLSSQLQESGFSIA